MGKEFVDIDQKCGVVSWSRVRVLKREKKTDDYWVMSPKEEENDVKKWK